jgi:hypothetical protein
MNFCSIIIFFSQNLNVKNCDFIFFSKLRGYKKVGPKDVKFFSWSNDMKLYWGFAQIIFLAGFASQGI